jgi:muramoyltetrapeptide carboxypeptidase
MLLKPERLRFGDTVGIVAPASAPPDPETIDRSVAALQKPGFRVQLAQHARKRFGFLAGSDRERAGDLMRMFADPKVKAILCVRGGYGTARLLQLLDYQTIRQNPKILVGHSDITSLHCALLTKASLVSFHGPMLAPDFAAKKTPAFTMQSFLRTVMEPSPPGSIRRGCEKQTVSVLRGGAAAGQLVGGNLSVLCTTLGTAYQPALRGRILFLEDVDEPPYKFDRLLTHLLNAGLLQQVAGVAVGVNRHCKDPRAGRTKEYRQTLDDVLKERLLPLGVPVLTGLPFGHLTHNATLPIGVRATLDAQNGDLLIADSAVK